MAVDSCQRWGVLWKVAARVLSGLVFPKHVKNLRGPKLKMASEGTEHETNLREWFLVDTSRVLSAMP